MVTDDEPLIAPPSVDILLPWDFVCGQATCKLFSIGGAGKLLRSCGGFFWVGGGGGQVTFP